MADAEAKACSARGGSRVQMVVPTQLCRDNRALGQPCQVVLALVGTHTCAGQMVLVPLPSGDYRGGANRVPVSIERCVCQ